MKFIDRPVLGNTLKIWHIAKTGKSAQKKGGSLRIHGSIPDMRDNLHDQGSAIIDSYIVSDFEPSSIKEFSGVMRFFANISEIDKNWKNVPK